MSWGELKQCPTRMGVRGGKRKKCLEENNNGEKIDRGNRRVGEGMSTSTPRLKEGKGVTKGSKRILERRDKRRECSFSSRIPVGRGEGG